MFSVLVVDIIADGKFKHQYGFEFNPLFPIDSRDLEKAVRNEYPSLKNKEIHIDFVCVVSKKDYRSWKKYNAVNDRK